MDARNTRLPLVPPKPGDAPRTVRRLLTGGAHRLRLTGDSDRYVYPVIFVPGVMGSRLRVPGGDKVWDPGDKLFMLLTFGLLDGDAKKKKDLVIGPSGVHSETYLAVDTLDLLHNLHVALELVMEHAELSESAKTWAGRLSVFLKASGGRLDAPAWLLGGAVAGIGRALQWMKSFLAEHVDWVDPSGAPYSPGATADRWQQAVQDLVQDAQRESGPHHELLRGVGEVLAPYVKEGRHGLVRALAYVLERNLGGLYWAGYAPVMGELSGEHFAGRARKRVRQEVEEKMRADAPGASDHAVERAAEQAAARVSLPAYGFGYNWTNSNRRSGKDLAAFIDDVMARYDRPGFVCDGVLLVTHSMGGLVSRSACALHGAASKVVGIVHGVQPCTGSPATYWRMKGGTEQPLVAQTIDNAGAADLDPKAEDLRIDGETTDESVSASAVVEENVMERLGSGVLGVDGREVTALMAQLPGTMELFCTDRYVTNEGLPGWLRIIDLTGKAPDRVIDPKGSPVRWKPVPPEEARSDDGQPAPHAREIRFPSSSDRVVDEVFFAADTFWATIDQPELLAPAGTQPDGEPVPPNPADVQAALRQYRSLYTEQTRPFHTDLGLWQHPRSAHFYGGGNSQKRSFRWVQKRGAHGLKDEEKGSEGPKKNAGKELQLVTTASSDQVTFLITPYTWKDAGAAWTQDAAEKLAHAVMTWDADTLIEHATSAPGDARALVGDPRDRARAAASTLTADAQATVSADGAASALDGGTEALQTGRVALAAGQDALDAAAGLLGQTRRALGALLRATKEAVAAGQDASTAAADAIAAARSTLDACQAALDALDRTSVTADEVFGALLGEALEALEAAGREAAAVAVREALREARAAVREAVEAGRQALGGAAASAEEAARLAASAAQQAVGAGKQAFEAGQSALADGLQAANRAAGGAEEAAREALRAAATALDAVAPALQAAVRALVQATSGLHDTTDYLTSALRDGAAAYAAAERLLAGEAREDGPPYPAQDLLVLLRTGSACLFATTSAVDAAQRTAEQAIEACEASIHAAEKTAEHAAEVAQTAARTFRNILDSSEQALDLTLERSRRALDLAASSFERGIGEAVRLAEQAAAAAESSVAQTWDGLRPAITDGLRAGADRLERSPEAIAEVAWDQFTHALAEHLRDTLAGTGDDDRAVLDEVLAEARAFLAAAQRTRKAGEKALASARRLVAVGESGLRDVLFGAEALGAQADQTAGAAGRFGRTLADVRVPSDGALATGQVTAKGSARVGLGDPAAVLGPRGEYGDGRVHIRRYRGGYDAFFAADDGTVLKATLQRPYGDGDGTVPRSSGLRLFTDLLPQAADPESVAPLGRAFADLAHEPAYKTWPARSFTLARLLDFLSETETGPGGEPAGPVGPLAEIYAPSAPSD